MGYIMRTLVKDPIEILGQDQVDDIVGITQKIVKEMSEAGINVEEMNIKNLVDVLK